MAQKTHHIDFKTVVHDHDSLMEILCKFEEDYDCTSVEVLSQYVKGNIEYVTKNPKVIEKWLDAIILFFGLPEIKRVVG